MRRQGMTAARKIKVWTDSVAVTLMVSMAIIIGFMLAAAIRGY